MLVEDTESNFYHWNFKTLKGYKILSKEMIKCWPLAQGLVLKSISILYLCKIQQLYPQVPQRKFLITSSLKFQWCLK